MKLYGLTKLGWDTVKRKEGVIDNGEMRVLSYMRKNKGEASNDELYIAVEDGDQIVKGLVRDGLAVELTTARP